MGFINVGIVMVDYILIQNTAAVSSIKMSNKKGDNRSAPLFSAGNDCIVELNCGKAHRERIIQ